MRFSIVRNGALRNAVAQNSVRRNDMKYTKYNYLPKVHPKFATVGWNALIANVVNSVAASLPQYVSMPWSLHAIIPFMMLTTNENQEIALQLFFFRFLIKLFHILNRNYLKPKTIFFVVWWNFVWKNVKLSHQFFYTYCTFV